MSLIYANGTADENRAYCTKADPEGFFEVGSIGSVGQGRRSDLEDVADTLKAGATIEEIAEKYPVQLIKYPRGITNLKSILDKKKVPEERNVIVTIYYGEGGTGKTQHVLRDAKRLGVDLYILSPPNGNTIWWDNYDGEAGLLLDDFYGWIKPHDLYRILDRYRFQIPIKGGHVWARWSYVWITSNNSPGQFYKDEIMMKLDKTAYNRRFHNIFELKYRNEKKDSVYFPIEDKQENQLFTRNVILRNDFE